MAELEILEGRAEAARERLVPLLDRPGLEECDVTVLLPVLAWAHLERGQVDEAAEAVEQALRRARSEEMHLVLVEALRVRALVALRREQWDKAARSLEEGLARARAMPHPYAEARLLLVYGEVHGQKRELAAARARLEAAQVLFARLGARMDSERVERALGTLSQNDGLRCYETVVSDAQWASIQAVLPPPARMGRRWADDRRTLEAILYQRRTGCAWAAPGLPCRRRMGTKRRRTDGCGSGKRPAGGSGSRRWRRSRRQRGTGGTAVRARRTRRRASGAAAASARVSIETVCSVRPDCVAVWGRTR